MKATFDVSIIIDGNNVQTAMGLQKGFEGFNPDAFHKVQAAVLKLKKSLERELKKRKKCTLLRKMCNFGLKNVNSRLITSFFWSSVAS